MTDTDAGGGDEVVSTARLDVWREAVDTSVSILLGTVFSFLSLWVLIWFLPQKDVGKFFFLLPFVYLFVQVPNGIGSAVKKRVSERDSERSVYGVGGVLFAIGGLVLIGVVFIGGLQLLGTFSPIDISLSEQLAVVFVAFSFGISQVVKRYIAGCGKPGSAEKVKTYVGQVGIGLLTVVLLYIEPTVEMALIARGLAYFLVVGVLLYIAPEKGIVWPSWSVFEELWVFCKWSIPTSLLNDFYYRWDTLLLGFMVGAISISYYDSTVRIVTFGTAFAVGVSVAATVKLSGLHTSDKAVLPLAKDIVGVSSLVSFLLLIVGIFNAEYILTVLFGPEYAAAKWFFILMTVTQLFHGWRNQFEAIFKGVDYPRGTTGISFVAVIINIATAPVLVWKFGGIGVVLSTLLAECIRFTLYQRSLYELLDGFVVSRFLGSQVVGVGLAIVSIWVIKVLFALSGIWLFVVTVTVGALVFYGTVYILSTRLREIALLYFEERRSFRSKIQN